MPSKTVTALGQLSAIPLEIRQEIYHYYILLCRRIHDEKYPSRRWPTPSLLNNNSYILISSPTNGPQCQRKLINLFCANSTIHREVEEVFHTRFVYLFPMYWVCEVSSYLTGRLNARAKAQICRLSFVIRQVKAPRLSISQQNDLRTWKEGNALLAQCFPNLRTVCFEIRVPSSPVTTRLHKPMMEKCLAVARPFKDVGGLHISWVGEDHGAHIAQMCESVSGSGGDWPWTKYDEGLSGLREDTNERPVTSN